MLLLASTATSFMALQSCKSDKKAAKEQAKEEKEHIIEIITQNMDFQMPDNITSGWNTFRYKNMSSQTHFFLIDKYPEGKTAKDAKNLVVPVFDSAMQLIIKGKNEEGFAELANLPVWFSDVFFCGRFRFAFPKSSRVDNAQFKTWKLRS